MTRARPAGWLLDTSIAVRLRDETVASEISRIMEPIGLCPLGRLEQLFSATSGRDYDVKETELRRTFIEIDAPPQVMELALDLQRDLAHHHGMWHRVPLPDLFIAVTALARGYGVLHNDKDYERIAKVRPLILRRIE